MAKRKKARKNGSHAHRTTKRRTKKRNPSTRVMVMTRRKGSHRRHRNPGGVVGGGVKMVKNAMYGLLGLVVARQLPQMLLGARNTGIMGYAANLATAIASGWLGTRFVNAEAGQSMAFGGVMYAAARATGDYFNPLQKFYSLQGIGDPMAGIEPGYFPLPVPLTNSGNPIIPREIRAIASSPAAAAAASGGAPIPASVAAPGVMSGVGSPVGRYGGRW